MADWKPISPTNFPAYYFSALYSAAEGEMTLLSCPPDPEVERNRFYYWKHCVRLYPGAAPRAAEIFREHLVKLESREIGGISGGLWIVARPSPAAIMARQMRLPVP